MTNHTWPIASIGECLEPVSFPSAMRLLTKDYKSTGRFPIVDQGQELIAGWTDSEESVIASATPLIVFGDHTRAFKFIDFPFVRGADGTQLLKPRAGIDPLYFFYACRAVDLPSRGYNRHFSILRDLEIPIPEPNEQSNIGIVLRRLDQALQHQEPLLIASLALKRAAMRELFTRGLRGGPQRETEFGLLPDGWGALPLERIAEIQTGVAKGRKFPDAEMVEVPYLRVANVQDGHLDLTEMKTISIRRSEVERYRLQAGDVVLTEGGDFDKLGRGFIWRGELELCVHQNHVFAVRPDISQLLPEFFAYLAQGAYGKAYFLQVAHKTTNLACINSTKLKAFPVAFPADINDQREIVAILEAIDKKIDLHKRKRAVLGELFKALLRKLMTGEIRVSDLDLSALQTPTADVASS